MSSVESQEALYELLGRAGESRTFSAGEVVFEQGDDGDVMFVVVSGTVALRDGERTLDTVEAPGIFGEMALIESKPRSLSAVVEDSAELVEIPVRTFWVLVHETPYFARLVMRVMAARLRRTSAST
jgi:CRP/FNR family cyclic AMP-dependent transcriptional regulator